jgi:prevent-host-death family protein
MGPVNIHDAKTHFSRLVARAERGEEVIISRAGKPVAKLVRAEAPKRKRPKFGYMKGKIWMAPDFDAPDPELEKLFYDGPIEPASPAESTEDGE